MIQHFYFYSFLTYSEHIRKCSKLQIMIVFPVLIPVQNFLFPGTGRENLKCHGKGRDGKFEACIPGNHGKREFPLTPVNRVEEQDCRWPRTPTTTWTRWRSAQQPEKNFSLFRLVEAHNCWGEPELTWRQGPPGGNPQTRDQPPSQFRATLVFLTRTLFNWHSVSWTTLPIIFCTKKKKI